MALDISILSGDGRPCDTFSLTPDEHWSIFGSVNPELRMVCKLTDYYAEAEFSSSEISQLIEEFNVIKLSKSTPSEQKLIDQLIAIARKACLLKLTLAALPD